MCPPPSWAPTLGAVQSQAGQGALDAIVIFVALSTKPHLQKKKIFFSTALKYRFFFLKAYPVDKAPVRVS